MPTRLFPADSHFAFYIFHFALVQGVTTIDEFRIYDGRLTQEEIAVNYQCGPDALALPVTLLPSNPPPNLTLSWPAWDAGFKAESAASLGPASWSPASSAPALAGDRWSLSVSVTDPANFYRLKR